MCHDRVASQPRLQAPNGAAAPRRWCGPTGPRPYTRDRASAGAVLSVTFVGRFHYEVVVVFVERDCEPVQEALVPRMPWNGICSVLSSAKAMSVVQLMSGHWTRVSETVSHCALQVPPNTRMLSRRTPAGRILSPSASAVPRSKKEIGAPVSMSALSVQSPVAPCLRRMSSVGLRTGGLPSSRYGKTRSSTDTDDDVVCARCHKLRDGSLAGQAHTTDLGHQLG